MTLHMFSTVLSLHGHLFIYFRNWLQILRPHVAREHYFFKGTDKHSLLKHLEHFIKSVPVVPAKFAGPIPAGTTGTKWTPRPVCPSRCTPSYDANSFSMVQVLICLYFNIHSFRRRTSYLVLEFKKIKNMNFDIQKLTLKRNKHLNLLF